MSFADEYAQLEEFLKADPDYARFDAECVRLQKIVNEQNQAAHSAGCDFEAYSLCQETLEYAIHDVPDFKLQNLPLFNEELAASYLDIGAKALERFKRECLIRGGEASKKWAKALDELKEAGCKRQERRLILVDVWNERKASKKAAEQEESK